MRYVALAFLASALSAPAVAADTPNPAKTEKPKKEKKVCKMFPSGASRIGDVVCKTAAEWANGDGESRRSSKSRTTDVSDR